MCKKQNPYRTHKIDTAQKQTGICKTRVFLFKISPYALHTSTKNSPHKLLHEEHVTCQNSRARIRVTFLSKIQLFHWTPVEFNTEDTTICVK